MNNFLNIQELKNLGVRVIGTLNVQVSRKAVLHNPQNITLKNHIRIDDGVVLSAHGKIQIGNYVHIARNCLFYSGTEILLGDFCTVSAGCNFYGMTDDYSGNFLIGPTAPIETRRVVNGDIILSDYAAVGSKCVVLPNTLMQEGVAIGAMSLVKGMFDKWSIYGGNPAKFLKIRSDFCKINGAKLQSQLPGDYIQ